MWSVAPWQRVEVIGEPDLPGGRCVVGTTSIGSMSVTCVGVCIPWAGAHVSTGRRDRRAWEDHSQFLVGIHEVLRDLEPPIVVAGDFNQTIPPDRQPKRVVELLQSALGGLVLTTRGQTEHGRLIDHVAVSSELAVERVIVMPRVVEDVRVSDHTGVVVDLRT